MSLFNENSKNYDCHKSDDLSFNFNFKHPPRMHRWRIRFSDDIDDLIFEIVNNGYEQHLRLASNHLNNKIYSQLKNVSEKLQCIIYKIGNKNILKEGIVGQHGSLMLSLLLFINSQCKNY